MHPAHGLLFDGRCGRLRHAARREPVAHLGDFLGVAVGAQIDELPPAQPHDVRAFVDVRDTVGRGGAIHPLDRHGRVPRPATHQDAPHLEAQIREDRVQPQEPPPHPLRSAAHPAQRVVAREDVNQCGWHLPDGRLVVARAELPKRLPDLALHEPVVHRSPPHLAAPTRWTRRRGRCPRPSRFTQSRRRQGRCQVPQGTFPALIRRRGHGRLVMCRGSGVGRGAPARGTLGGQAQWGCRRSPTQGGHVAPKGARGTGPATASAGPRTGQPRASGSPAGRRHRPARRPARVHERRRQGCAR